MTGQPDTSHPADATDSGRPDPSVASAGSTTPAGGAAPAGVTGPAGGPEPSDRTAPAGGTTPGRRNARLWIGGIAIAVLVVVLLSPLASPSPDGLERVAEDQGFIGQATNLVGGLLGDYAIPGVGNEALSTVLSGLLGIVLVVGVLFLLGRLVARRRT